MYNPLLEEDLIRTLYRVKRFYKKPITRLADELIKNSLHTIDKESVCKTCIQENNQECDSCFLAVI